ncbi:hypothetical protein [Phocaeicola sp.]
MKRLLLVCLLFAGTFQAFGQSKVFTASAGKVGSLVAGQKFIDRSKSGEGLYNRVQKEIIEDEMDGDYKVYTLYWNAEKVISFRIDDINSEIPYTITVHSSKIQTIKGIKSGMLLHEALKLSTHKKLKWIAYMDTGGFPYVVCDGYRIWGTENCLSASGKKKAARVVEEGEVELVPEDFLPTTKVTGFDLEIQLK